MYNIEHNGTIKTSRFASALKSPARALHWNRSPLTLGPPNDLKIDGSDVGFDR